MVVLGHGQLAIPMPHYPHMMAEDIEVWTQFLKSEDFNIERVWYDVHVGGKMDPVLDVDHLGSRIAAGVSRKRIDVVAKLKNQIWVIEVKPFANYVSLGQVRMYHRLFCEEFKPDIECVPVVVCASCDPDVLADYQNQSIIVIEV